MKKPLSLTAAVLLLFSSAAGQALAEGRPTSADPPYLASVILDNVGAVSGVFDLGDRVEVEDEQDGFYVLKDGTLVEKWLVRLDTEEAPSGTTARAIQDAEKEAEEKALQRAEEETEKESTATSGQTAEEETAGEEQEKEEQEKAPAGRTVYVKNGRGTPLYDNPYCEGEPLRMLKFNQALTVEDEFGRMMRVMFEEEAPEPEKADENEEEEAEDAGPDTNAKPASSAAPAAPAEAAEDAQKEPVKIPVTGYLLSSETKNTIGYGYDYGGGGGGGGGGGADGGEISLTGYRVMPKKEGIVLLAAVRPDPGEQKQPALLAGVQEDKQEQKEAEAEEEPFVGGSGTILARGTENYACVFRRGDRVSVMNPPNDGRLTKADIQEAEKLQAEAEAADGASVGTTAETARTEAKTEEKEENAYEPIALSSLLLEDGSIATLPTKLLYFKGDPFYSQWKGYTKNNAQFYRNWRTHLEEPQKLDLNTEVKVLREFGDYSVVQLRDKTVGLVLTGMLSETKVAYGYDFGGGGGGGGGGEWTDPVL